MLKAGLTDCNRGGTLHTLLAAIFLLSIYMSSSSKTINRTQSLGSGPRNQIRARSNSLSSSLPSSPANNKQKGKEHDITIDVDSVKPSKKKGSTKSKEECPCAQSLGEYWLILCSNKQCNQRWHTHCSNLPGPCSENEVNSLTDNGWLCPWCFSSTFPQPKNHPVKKQDASLFSAATVSNLCEAIKETLVADIIPTMIPDNSSKTENLTTELNQLYQSIKGDLNNLQEEVERFNKGSCSVGSIDNSQPHEDQLHKEPSVTMSPSEEPPYTSLTEDFLEEDLLTQLNTYVNSVGDKFLETAKNRKTLYFGEYGYKYGETKHGPAASPDIIKSLMASVQEKFPDEHFNSCLISQYDNGSDFCPSHKDDEPWIDPKSNICTISIGCQRTMRFSKPNNMADDLEPESSDLQLPINSMLIFSRKSQETWKHSVIPDKAITSKRWSFTLRHIKPHFMNSTIIVGDSNTQDLKFGDSKGCFGAWIPGDRIKAGRINDIPDPDKLYPYQNLLLHVGLNDINRRNRETSKELISNLDLKCKSISQAYPNMKIYISLLLPTTNQELNSAINEFNQKLHMLVDSRTYLKGTIQHHYLLDDQRKLKNQYCRDYIHLNNSGICEFVRTIKASIIHRRPGSVQAQGNQLHLQSRVTSHPPRRMPTAPSPWITPNPYPYPHPVPPPPGVGWLPPGICSSPQWLPPTQPCPPWLSPPHPGPGASGFNSFNSSYNSYKVRNNIQRVDHRQQA